MFNKVKMGILLKKERNWEIRVRNSTCINSPRASLWNVACGPIFIHLVNGTTVHLVAELLVLAQRHLLSTKSFHLFWITALTTICFIFITILGCLRLSVVHYQAVNTACAHLPDLWNPNPFLLCIGNGSIVALLMPYSNLVLLLYLLRFCHMNSHSLFLLG